MSYNGSGTFSINSAGQPVITGTVISSTAFNALTADLATGLSTAITKDGQTTTTARILFAQGVSSTLVTDATSATTGSIITAGGISMQKALWVGTTSRHVGAATFDAAITYGGVTLSNAVTGTGNMVLSASPTLTGTLTAAAATFSSAVTLTGSGASNAQVLTSTGATTGSIRYNLANTGGNAWLGIDSSAGGQLATSSTAYSTVFGSVGATSLHLITSDIVRFTINSAGAVTNAGSLTQTGAFTYGGVTLSNSVTGTGSMVLSAAPTLTGNLTLGSTNSSILQGTGGTGATTPTIQMNGGSASDGGVYIRFARNSVVKGYIGTASAVIGGTSDDIAVHSASALRLYAGSTQSLTVSAAGAVQFNVGYGAGTITSDASGNLTSVSDPAEKDFVAPYKPGLPQILAIARNDKFMGLHRWRKDNRSNQETEGVYASFFAHDDFPLADAVHKGTNGINSFSDRPVVMALVNAVAELKAEIATLKSKVN